MRVYRQITSWNCVIKSVPNRLLVFFSTNDFNLRVFPLNVVSVINSHKGLIFSPVTDLAILVDLIMVGVPNFFKVCELIIVRADPDFSWNFTLLFNIFTCTDFLILASSGSSDLVFFMLLIILFLDRLCELLCPTRSHKEHFFRKVQSLCQCTCNLTKQKAFILKER